MNSHTGARGDLIAGCPPHGLLKICSSQAFIFKIAFPQNAFIKITNDLHITKSNGQFSVLVLFSLLAASCTVDHFFLWVPSSLGCQDHSGSPPWLLLLSLLHRSHPKPAHTAGPQKSLLQWPLQCPSFTFYLHVFDSHLHILCLDFPSRLARPAAYWISTFTSNRHLTFNRWQNEHKILSWLKKNKILLPLSPPSSQLFRIKNLECPQLLSFPQSHSPSIRESFFSPCSKCIPLLFTPSITTTLTTCLLLSLPSAKPFSFVFPSVLIPLKPIFNTAYKMKLFLKKWNKTM